MEITIAAVGKIKEKYIQSGIKDYIDRLERFCSVDMIEIKPEKIKKNLTGAQIEEIKREEGERILQRLPEDNYLIALSVKGKPMTSEGLAKSIKNIRAKGKRKVTFIVGGPLGLSDEVMKKADYTLSLSHMTFTHQMIRLILLEQIYRAYKIINQEPYHK